MTFPSCTQSLPSNRNTLVSRDPWTSPLPSIGYRTATVFPSPESAISWPVIPLEVGPSISSPIWVQATSSVWAWLAVALSLSCVSSGTPVSSGSSVSSVMSTSDVWESPKVKNPISPATITAAAAASSHGVLLELDWPGSCERERSMTASSPRPVEVTWFESAVATVAATRSVGTVARRASTSSQKDSPGAGTSSSSWR